MNKDYSFKLDALEQIRQYENNVRYVIVDAYAFAVHAFPRATDDIDIFISNEKENAQAVITVLHEFGFGSLGIDEDNLMQPDMIVQLGYPPYRIDIITSIEIEEIFKILILCIRSHCQIR